MTVRYSNSSIANYIGCPLKYFLGDDQGLAPLAPQSAHDARFGTAWHAAMQTYYTALDASASFDEAVVDAQAAFADAYPESAYPAILPARSQGKTFVNGIAAIAAYADRWREEDSHFTILYVEQLEAAADTPDIDRVLRLDLVYRDDRDDMIYGRDFKTTGGYIDNYYWGRYEPNSQIRQYAAHLTEKYAAQGEGIGGFVIDATGFKHRSKAVTPRKGPNKGVYQPAGDWHDFGRMTFNPNANALELEAGNVAYWIGRIEADRAAGVWGYNTNHCRAYGELCQYYWACKNGYAWPGDEELLLTQFRQVCREVIDGDLRCQLDRGHDGPHDSTPPPPPDAAADYEMVVDEAVEASDDDANGWITE